MAAIILVIIYLTFISLGLPNSLLGSAWPVMQADFGVPLSSAGIISLIISGGMIVSSFFSGKIISRFNTERIALFSVALTALALLGYWSLPSFVWLCIAAFPLGLGSGALDTVLNHYVAVHYNAGHMNWLHSFWGVGATLGPLIMSVFIAQNNAWRKGYLAVSMIQFGVIIMLLLTLSLWKKIEKPVKAASSEKQQKDGGNLFNIPGVKISLISFCFYFALEASIGLWGTSYLVNFKDVSAGTAARWLSMFFIGITTGRFVSGFIAMKLKNHILIRIGLLTAMSGAITLLLPLPVIFSMIGLLLIGLGSAPVVPSMLQATPHRFGEQASQFIMGYQMAFGFMGSTFIPPALGLIASKSSIIILPFFILASVLIVIAGSEALNRLFVKTNEDD